MNVKAFAEKLEMRILTGDAGLERKVGGLYVCDLLSWVMSHAERGDAWITVHTHLNIVAVALLAEISCIIVPESISVEEATINKAVEEAIPILVTDKKAYEICWKTHDLFE